MTEIMHQRDTVRVVKALGNKFVIYVNMDAQPVNES